MKSSYPCYNPMRLRDRLIYHYRRSARGLACGVEGIDLPNGPFLSWKFPIHLESAESRPLTIQILTCLLLRLPPTSLSTTSGGMTVP